MTAPIRYARSGDVNVAYQLTGDGPFDLVLVPGFFSHLEIDWEYPGMARMLDRLGSFARLIRFDKRGTGLSDRSVGLPDFEARMDDVRAVMDAAGSAQAALFGYSEGGPMCVLFAATYPDRTRALALYGTYAKRRDPDEDYPWAPTAEERLRYAHGLEATWGEDVDISTMSPNADEAMRLWYQRRGRASLSPAAARDLILMNSQSALLGPRVAIVAAVPARLTTGGTLDLTRVHSGSHVEPEYTQRFANLESAANGPSRTVEDREEAVAGGVDLLAGEADELTTYCIVVRSEERRPSSVAKGLHSLGRPDEVGEENRGEDPIRRRSWANSRKERLDLVDDVVGACGRHVIVPAQLDESSAWDPRRDVSLFTWELGSRRSQERATCS